jgi:hypothetical protein
MKYFLIKHKNFGKIAVSEDNIVDGKLSHYFFQDLEWNNVLEDIDILQGFEVTVKITNQEQKMFFNCISYSLIIKKEEEEVYIENYEKDIYLDSHNPSIEELEIRILKSISLDKVLSRL